MNNIRLKYNPINSNGVTADLGINIPVLSTWDLNGINESIDIYESEVVQQSINPIEDFETIRYSHKDWVEKVDGVPQTSTNYNFYFFSAETDASITATTNDERWVMDYRANGYTNQEVYYYDGVFSKSYFKLDFYDSKNSTRQQILLTIIIPTQQGKTMGVEIGQNQVFIRKPQFILNHTGDKEGYYVYWLKNREFLDIDTLYMSCKYYDAGLGQFKRMMNISQGTYQDKFNFSQEDTFYYTLKLNYELYQYEVYLDNTTTSMTRVGTENNPIKWYEYVNP